MIKRKKFFIISASILLLLFISGGGYWYFLRRSTTASTIEPSLPKQPKDASEQLKGMYSKAIDAHQKRLATPSYGAFMMEGLEWKTVGDFTPTDKNTYYTYAAFVYTEGGKAYPKEWVPWLNVGNMFMLMGDGYRAEQAYKKSAEIGTDRYEPLSALLDVLRSRSVKPTAEIMNYFRERIPKVVINRTPLTITYGQYLLENGETAETLTLLQSVLKVDPNDLQIKAEYDDLSAVLQKKNK